MAKNWYPVIDILTWGKKHKEGICIFGGVRCWYGNYLYKFGYHSDLGGEAHWQFFAYLVSRSRCFDGVNGFTDVGSI